MRGFGVEPWALDENQHRYIFLDGLRGLAALSIAFGHAAHDPKLGYFFPNGAMAVDFFFCLSGFVLASAYDRKLTEGLSVSSFMTRRMIRLYPMIFFGVILGTLVQGYLHPATYLTIALDGGAALFFIPSGLFRGSDLFPVNGPMWSLFFEVSACIGYALAARSLPRQAWLPLASLAGIVLAFYIQHMGDVTQIGIQGRGSFLAGFARCAYPFVVGILLFRTGRLRSLPWNGVALAVVLLFVLVSPVRTLAAYQIAVVLFVLPSIVALGANVKSERLAATWDALGRLSYPLYLVHFPLVQLMEPRLAVSLPMFPRAAL
jgi:peptidoglycan/LPS O-acetylase OafA/YrhL